MNALAPAQSAMQGAPGPLPNSSTGQLRTMATEALRQGTTKPQSHKGEGPPDTYLVQLVTRFNTWSVEETGIQVFLTSEGKALQVLMDLQPPEQAGWPAIEGALQCRFGP